MTTLGWKKPTCKRGHPSPPRTKDGACKLCALAYSEANRTRAAAQARARGKYLVAGRRLGRSHRWADRLAETGRLRQARQDAEQLLAAQLEARLERAFPQSVPLSEEQRAERRRQYQRVRPPGSREKHRAYEAKYAASHRDEIRASARARHPSYRAENLEKFEAKNRASTLLRYGLTVEQYDAMLEAQGGVCAICKKPETRTRRGKILPLVVEHNHETNEVRALTCHRCNSVIGYSGESPEILRATADYLEAHKGTQ